MIGPRWRLLVPAPLRWAPDLVAVVVLTLAAFTASFTPLLSGTPVQLFFGLPLVFFLPGYAFVAALFPRSESAGRPTYERGENRESGDRADKPLYSWPGVSLAERMVLSVGLSFAVVPLLTLVVNFTPWGINPETVLSALALFVFTCAAVGTARRTRLPPEERFTVPVGAWSAAARDRVGSSESRADVALSVLLVVSVLVTATTVGGALASTESGEQFTELYLLTEDEEGALIADDYPTQLTRGEGVPLVVGVANQEQRPQSYTVVVAFERVDRDGNSVSVLDRQTVERFQLRLAHNETWLHHHTATPTVTGEDVRLVYLLYHGEPPSVTTTETAYRSVHLWVTVEP